jgi:phage terminase large subunit
MAAFGRKTKPSPKATDAAMGEKFIKTLMPKARHKALFGGRGGGKSWAVATYLVITAAKHKKKIVCARQFQNSIRDSSKELIEKRIEALGLVSEFAFTDREILHKGTKSTFLFTGLDRNIDSIRSLEGADTVWVEEARTIKEKSMEVLLPTVRAAGSELIWTWNPELPTDPVDSYFRDGEAPPDAIVTHVSWRDNPFFALTAMPQEMDLLKKGNFLRYKHVWEGEYDTRHESKVYPNARTGRIDIDPDTMVARYGMDFGFGSDPSFVVKVYVDHNRRRIYVAGEASGRVGMDDLPLMVRSVVSRDDDQLRCDSSQPGTIEFLRRRGLNAVGAKKGPGSIKSGIQFIQSYDLIIDPDCESLREECRLYTWMMDRLTGQILNTPIDANNHGLDALRYALEDLSIEGQDPGPDKDGGVIKLNLWRRRA